MSDDDSVQTPRATISGTNYLYSLSRFIKTHETALAAYHGSSSNRTTATTTNGTSGPSWGTILTLGILPSSNSNESSSSASSVVVRPPQPSREPLVLSFDPHHLYYILLKFDELGLLNDDNGDSRLDIKSFNDKDWNKPMTLTLNHQSSSSGRLEIIREGNSNTKKRSQSLFSGFFRGGSSGASEMRPKESHRDDDDDSKSNFSFGSGWWGLGNSSGSNTTTTKQQDEGTIVRHIYSTCTKLPALKLSPFIFTTTTNVTTSRSSLPNEAIEGFTDLPPLKTCIPLNLFHSLTSLYLIDLDPRSFTGWDRLSIGLKKFSLVRSGIQDLGELILDCVVEDEERRERKDKGESFGQEFVGQTRENRRNNDHASTREDGDDEEEEEEGDLKKRRPSRLAWSSLRHLSLHDNSLTFIPTTPLLHLSLLTSLDLSSNLLISIPPSLSNLPFLRSLNLENNMIDNLHSLPTILGNIEVLNLSENRLENLSGLDKLLNLKRLDLRLNGIRETLEISRLNRLQFLKEVWLKGNPFTFTKDPILEGEEHDNNFWRIECFGYFVEERGFESLTEDSGRGSIKIDGKGLQSNRERKLVELQVRKRTGRHSSSIKTRVSNTTLNDSEGAEEGGLKAKKVVVEPRRRVVTAPLSSGPSLVSQPNNTTHLHRDDVSGGGGHQKPHRRKPRRIVDLDTPPSLPATTHGQLSDSDTTTTTVTSSSGREGNGGAAMTPSRQISQTKFASSPSRIRVSPQHQQRSNVPLPYSSSEIPTASSSALLRRDRVSTSTYEAPEMISGEGASSGGGEALRKKIEKLREEVGENWLSVLGEREARALALQQQQEREKLQQKEEEVKIPRNSQEQQEQQERVDELGNHHHQSREEPSSTVEGLTVSAGVKVVKKKGKKKKGKGK